MWVDGAMEERHCTERGSERLSITLPHTAPHCSVCGQSPGNKHISKGIISPKISCEKKKTAFPHLISIKHPDLLVWTEFMRTKWGTTIMKQMYYLANVVNYYILFSKLCLTQMWCSFRSNLLSSKQAKNTMTLLQEKIS